MAEKVSIKIPSHLACYVRPETDPEVKLRVVRDQVELSARERTTVLFVLCYDRDGEVRKSALAAMRQLSLASVSEMLASPHTHPRMVDMFARFHGTGDGILQQILMRDDLLPETALMLAQQLEKTSLLLDDSNTLPGEEEEAPDLSGEDISEPEPDATEEEAVEPVPEEEAVEEDAKFKSKYQLAQGMGVAEKIKMALTGDKEWRSILVKDSNKLVNGAVVKNPRITEPEILAISKSVIQNDEILRVICHNKEWVKNYEIRKALVLNHKTPLPVSLRFMAFLTVKDVAAIAKSKNVASVLANQARRILTNKKRS